MVRPLELKALAAQTLDKDAAFITPIEGYTALEFLLLFIESRNVMINVAHNVLSMKEVSHCRDFISVIAKDPTRPNVARLIPILCAEIFSLAQEFEDALEGLLSKSKTAGTLFTPDWSEAYKPIYSKTGALIIKCGSILRTFFPDYDIERENSVAIAHDAVHLLDVAVISYVGAHLSNKDLFPSGMIAVPFSTGYMGFVFQQRSFKCLNGFLDGRRAWVCHKIHHDFLGDRPDILDPKIWDIEQENMALQSVLYLATDAVTFADVWGPMWCEKQSIESDQILRYRVGNGILVPWKYFQDNEDETSTSGGDLSLDSCLLKPTERLCHGYPTKTTAWVNTYVASLKIISSATTSLSSELTKYSSPTRTVAATD